jgi:hypothetical protein
MSMNSNRVYLARSGAAQNTSTPVALVAATAKTVVSTLGTANTTLALFRWRVSFNSVAATDAPALVEVGIVSTLGTVTAFTPSQIFGTSVASVATAGYNATVEPTYVRLVESLYVPVNNGVYEYTYSLGTEAVCAASQGLAIRVTAPQAQSCYASIFYAE